VLQGACPDVTRLREPPLGASSPWHARVAANMQVPYESICDPTGTMLVFFAQGTAKAYPRYIVTLRPKVHGGGGVPRAAPAAAAPNAAMQALAARVPGLAAALAGAPGGGRLPAAAPQPGVMPRGQAFAIGLPWGAKHRRGRR
jgi:hypothetical protein